MKKITILATLFLTAATIVCAASCEKTGQQQANEIAAGWLHNYTATKNLKAGHYACIGRYSSLGNVHYQDASYLYEVYVDEDSASSFTYTVMGGMREYEVTPISDTEAEYFDGSDTYTEAWGFSAESGMMFIPDFPYGDGGGHVFALTSSVSAVTTTTTEPIVETTSTTSEPVIEEVTTTTSSATTPAITTSSDNNVYNSRFKPGIYKLMSSSTGTYSEDYQSFVTDGRLEPTSSEEYLYVTENYIGRGTEKDASFVMSIYTASRIGYFDGPYVIWVKDPYETDYESDVYITQGVNSDEIMFGSTLNSPFSGNVSYVYNYRYYSEIGRETMETLDTAFNRYDKNHIG